MDKLGRQCCGGEVVYANLVCCGNSTSGMSHNHDPKMICCGSSYNHVDTSVCCTDILGFSKVKILYWFQLRWSPKDENNSALACAFYSTMPVL